MSEDEKGLCILAMSMKYVKKYNKHLQELLQLDLSSKRAASLTLKEFFISSCLLEVFRTLEFSVSV